MDILHTSSARFCQRIPHTQDQCKTLARHLALSYDDAYLVGVSRFVFSDGSVLTVDRSNRYVTD